MTPEHTDMPGAARLREALERTREALNDYFHKTGSAGEIDRAYAIVSEALAAVPEAPEPVYEWRACGVQVNGMEWVGPARVWFTTVLSELPDLLRQNADVWIERRVVVAPGPWERVEEGTER